MDFLTGLQSYVVVAVAVSLTSYIRLYRPSIELMEEILEEEMSAYKGTVGFVIWNFFATVGAPWVALILLKNNNEETIETLAVAFANKHMED